MRARTRTICSQAFTIIELLISLVILSLLIGLLLVAFGRATETSRRAVDQQTVRALGTAIETFKSELGFLPPLVKDDKPGYPCDAVPGADMGPIEGGRPVVFSTSDQADLDYLRAMDFDTADPTSPDCRFSEYSLPYYLVGVLGPDPDQPDTLIDGVDGPGFYQPLRSGGFNTAGGRRFDPLYNPGGSGARLVAVDQSDGRWELRDRNGASFRFYRWEQGKAEPGGGFDAGEIEELDDLNVPNLLGDPEEDPALRSAEYAIVGAGPNGVFGDPPFEDGYAGLGSELGIDDTEQERILAEARRDNVVEVGRE